jgi:hypothetical protein
MATKIGITEARGQFIVVDDDGNQYGTYDDRKKAAAKAREVKREMEDTEESQPSGSGFQDKASRFASAVNRTAQKAGNKAKSAAQSVDTGESDSSSGGMSGGMSMLGGDSDGDSSPSMPSLMGDTESGEMGLGFGGGGDSPDLPFGGESGQEVDIGFLEADSEGGDPSIPSMMDGDADVGELPFGESGDDPMVPGFGMEENDANEPELRFL